LLLLDKIEIYNFNFN